MRDDMGKVREAIGAQLDLSAACLLKASFFFSYNQSYRSNADDKMDLFHYSLFQG